MTEGTQTKKGQQADTVSLTPNLGRPTLPTNTETTTFELRNVKGRDGKGPCSVVRRTLMMPNGDIAPINATFDPVVEKMTRVTYQRLIAKKRITAADKKVEDKLLKEKTVTKKVGNDGGNK